tara:strand:+ start:395 stop:601 length:207 start_codon:yes stop_codon:yes gene_type:complete
MKTESKGKNVCIYIPEDDAEIWNNFNQYCKKRYRSRLGGIHDLMVFHDYYSQRRDEMMKEFKIQPGGF